jgi:hypothetical protein
MPPLLRENRKTPPFVHLATERARDWWLSGHRPQEFFVLSPARKRDQTLHLFTTRAMALEYRRVTGSEAPLLTREAGTIAAFVDSNFRCGMKTFVLDRCARCSAANFVDIEMLRNPEQLGQLWAFTLIFQRERMCRCAAAAFQSLLAKRVNEIVPTLKEMRDHVNAGCAAVHYTLGLLHSLEAPAQQHGLLDECVHRLRELGHHNLADELPTGSAGLRLGFAQLHKMAERNFELESAEPKSMTACASQSWD